MTDVAVIEERLRARGYTLDCSCPDPAAGLRFEPCESCETPVARMPGSHPRASMIENNGRRGGCRVDGGSHSWNWKSHTVRRCRQVRGLDP